jgi:hypothetical protein
MEVKDLIKTQIDSLEAELDKVRIDIDESDQTQYRRFSELKRRQDQLQNEIESLQKFYTLKTKEV